MDEPDIDPIVFGEICDIVWRACTAEEPAEVMASRAFDPSRHTSDVCRAAAATITREAQNPDHLVGIPGPDFVESGLIEGVCDAVSEAMAAPMQNSPEFDSDTCLYATYLILAELRRS